MSKVSRVLAQRILEALLVAAAALSGGYRIHIENRFAETLPVVPSSTRSVPMLVMHGHRVFASNDEVEKFRRANLLATIVMPSAAGLAFISAARRHRKKGEPLSLPSPPSRAP